MRELKLRPLKGILSTNRLPISVLTEASEVLSSGALPKPVILSDLLPIVKAKSSRASNSAPAGFRFRRGPEGEAEERQWGAAIHRSPSDPDARVGVVHLRLGKGGAGGWGSEGRSSPAGPAIGGPPGPSGTVLTGGSVGEQGLIEVTDPILHEDLLKPQHESGRCTLRARRGVAPVSLRQEAGE